MNTILRNFLSVLRKYKLATLLNVLGLSVAFAAFMVIMMQVDYEQTFDRELRNVDKIFRVDVFSGKWLAIINRPLSNAFISSSPHIVAGALEQPNTDHNKLFFAVESNNEKHFFEEEYCIVTPSYADVFTFDMVEGNDKAMLDPEKALLPLSIAKKIFGNESAVGKRLEGRNRTLTVGGVYKDFQKNSSVGNVIYFPIAENENLSNWSNWNYSLYIRLDDKINADGLVDNFKRTFDMSVLPDFIKNGWNDGQLRVTPFSELHFTTDVTYDSTPKGSRRTIFILGCIAFAIVAIAGINYTNFSAALAPKRIRSINTQKVLGESVIMIRAALLIEALTVCFISFLIAIGLMYAFRNMSFSSLVDADISLKAYPGLVLATATLSIVVGAMAGFYPAMYVTSVPAVIALKGNFGLSQKGRALRSVLIGVQFIASFALIIAAAFMYLQNHYMMNASLGYDKDAIIVTKINRKIHDQRVAFENKLKNFADIRNITFAEQILSSKDQYMGWGRNYHDKNISFQCLPVTYSFLDVMGVTVSDGRNFRPEDANLEYGAYIFNEKARKEYDLQLNEKIDGAEIVGFMPDVKFASFRTEVEPMAFFVWGTENWGSTPDAAYIKVESNNLFAAMNHVREALAEFDSEYTFDVRFYDDVLQSTYENERKLSSLITIFSIVAVLISIVGVFGLVIFDSEYRRKEISLRKVHGATTTGILILFNKTYMRIVGICFILAAPAAYYAVSRWLENFAYKTPIHWWIFPAAFIAVALITSLTVTVQNFRAANVNPVESLKNE
jgi:putative ABC transport system permease protein